MKRLLIILLLLLFPGCVYEIEPVVIEEPEIIQPNISEPAVIEPAEPELRVVHWTHMPVTYYVTNEQECGDYEIRKIQRAFEAIEDATNNIVTFKKIDIPADIDITCSFLEGCYKKTVDIREEEGVVYRYETICAHDKGRAQITALRGFEILKARIELIGLAGFAETKGRGPSGFYVGSCGHSTTEIHEILHAFGFGHIDDPKSIMYPAAESVGFTIQEEGSCLGSKKEIDKIIVDKLIEVYSSEKFK